MTTALVLSNNKNSDTKNGSPFATESTKPASKLRFNGIMMTSMLKPSENSPVSKSVFSDRPS